MVSSAPHRHNEGNSREPLASFEEEGETELELVVAPAEGRLGLDVAHDREHRGKVRPSCMIGPGIGAHVIGVFESLAIAEKDPLADLH